MRAHKDVGAGPGRGLGEYDGKLFAVSGTRLYQVPLSGSAAAASNLGSIPGTQRCSMASNTIVLGIVAAPSLYTWNGTAVAQVTDTDFTSRGALKIGFIDGYFVFPEPNSGRHFSSDLYAVTFDALKFATAEMKPDILVDMLVNQRQISYFGKKSTELWYNAGLDNYPFEKMSGGDIELGCLGGTALQDNAEWFLANDKTYRRLAGQTGLKVSTHAVEEKIETYTNLDQCFAFSYTIEGHLVVVVTFPEQATWCFDVTTGEWHERQSYGRNDWRVCDALEIDGVTYVQDTVTGKVGILDPNTFDEWGQTLRGECTYPSVYSRGTNLFFNMFELIMRTGVGLPAGQGSAPAVMLECSDDGGMTWWTAENRNIGAIGNYHTRVFWHELGSSHDRIFRVSISDPVRFELFDTRVAAEPGEF